MLDKIVASVGAWWGADSAGVFRIAILDAASGTAVITFTANDLKKPLQRLPMEGKGRLPIWRALVRYARNYVVQASDIAGGVSDARRSEIGREWREAKAENTEIQDGNLLAPELIIDTLLAEEADAQAEADRLLKLYEIQRAQWQTTVQLNDDTVALDMADVVEIVHERYGLETEGSDAGGLFTIIGIEPDFITRDLALTLWGPNGGLQNLVTDDGDFLVTGAGKYLLTSAE